MPAILDALRAAGVRCTPQRYAVLEFLVREHTHATADQIADAINRRDPRASRATVYNSLHALMDAGLVREVGGGAAARYDAHLERHHHFACDRCGALEDIPWFEIPRAAGARSLGARRVNGYEILFRGLCRTCQDREKAGLRPRRGE
jgi:Fe2+ or Zn2+ uptake regulation protein